MGAEPGICAANGISKPLPACAWPSALNNNNGASVQKVASTEPVPLVYFVSFVVSTSGEQANICPSAASTFRGMTSWTAYGRMARS